MAKYKLSADGVKDTETGACIPNADGNRHWQQYLLWLEGKDALGFDMGTGPNTPDPEFTEEEINRKIIDDEIQELRSDLQSALVWQFRMIMELWDIGKDKGIWVAGDITNHELKSKVASWKNKLDRLTELGE